MWVENIVLGLHHPSGQNRDQERWYVPTRTTTEIELPWNWDRRLYQREDHELTVFDYTQPVKLLHPNKYRWQIVPTADIMSADRITIVQFDPGYFVYDPGLDKELDGVSLVFSDARAETELPLDWGPPPITLLFQHHRATSHALLKFWDLNTFKTANLCFGAERAFMF